MKKLMILAAVALCASFAANAYSVNWQITAKTSGSSPTGYQPLNEGTWNLYLINAADVATADWNNIANESYFSDLAYDSKLEVAATGSGIKTVKTGDSVTVADAKNLAQGDASWVLVMVNGDKFYASDTRTGTVYDSGDALATPTSAGLSFTAAAPLMAANMKSFASSDVPEPTSGLLLLLGVAGLALRRRHA